MSQFLKDTSHYASEQSNEIDFEDAIRLPDGGSTCDLYRTKWQRREVFVKRLKEEYRTNPLYLDALDKEYEIGVSLKHPSLPDYREFHRDYIVMDYIDGTTLADMIKHNDSWLSNETNIVKFLKELVEVTGYLHRHNVTHCDIKPDNIMITANNHNLVLVDLDKCYTDSLNDTSGDPSKYGLPVEEQGRITIDFHGIGRIVEKLKEEVPNFNFSRYKEFIKECYSPDVTDQDLINLLDYKPGNSYRKFYWMVTLAPFCVALIYGLVLWLTQGKDGYDNSYGADISVPKITDTIKETPIVESEKNNELEDEKKIDPGNTIPAPRSQEQIQEQSKEMAAQLDKRIKPLYDKLNSRLERIEKFAATPDVTKEQLADSLDILINLQMEYGQETFEILREMYPGLNDREAWRIMSKSKVYTGYTRKSSDFLKRTEKTVKSEE